MRCGDAVETELDVLVVRVQHEEAVHIGVSSLGPGLDLRLDVILAGDIDDVGRLLVEIAGESATRDL